MRTARQRSEPSQKWQGNIRLPGGCARRTRYAELWRTLASDVTLGPGAGRVQGGEAGVRYQPPETRFWLRLAYRVDDALVGVMARSETVEAVLVSVGVGLP